MIARLVLSACAVLALVAASGTAAAPPSGPVPQCSPGPCGGWHTSDVAVTWTWDAGATPVACEFTTISAEGTSSVSCTAKNADGSTTTSVQIKIDKTAPAMSASPARAPDRNGWYRGPVEVVLSATDATSGLASCDRPTYGGPDTQGTTVGGSCRDQAGNVSSTAVSLRYDATAPSVAPQPERAPDGNGWYRRPVGVAFSGSDPVSGIEACSQMQYAGPDSPTAVVAGACTDAAGNTAWAELSLRYDATPPELKSVVAMPRERSARIAWAASPDTKLVQIVRSPGLRSAASTVVYRGVGSVFTDRTVQVDTRYRYEVRGVDEAGNAAATIVRATALAAVIGRDGPRPDIRWRKVPRAVFYNVQAFRGRTKVLTTWVRGTRLRLPRNWGYAGRKQRLRAGRYRVFVWPAFGSRSEPRFGKLLGETSVLVRAARR